MLSTQCIEHYQSALDCINTEHCILSTQHKDNIDKLYWILLTNWAGFYQQSILYFINKVYYILSTLPETELKIIIVNKLRKSTGLLRHCEDMIK